MIKSGLQSLGSLPNNVLVTFGFVLIIREYNEVLIMSKQVSLICNYCQKEFSCIYKQRKTRKFCSKNCVDKYKTIDPIIRFKKNIVIDEISKCWLYQGSLSHGYGRIEIKNKRYLAHRFSYEIHKEPIKNPLLFVCHHCDIRNCVNPDHLFLGTAKDNVLDMFKKGRHPIHKGQDAWHAKLNDPEVIQIKKLLETEISMTQIAKMFGVHIVTIHDIKYKKTWAHLI